MRVSELLETPGLLTQLAASCAAWMSGRVDVHVIVGGVGRDVSEQRRIAISAAAVDDDRGGRRVEEPEDHTGGDSRLGMVDVRGDDCLGGGVVEVPAQPGLAQVDRDL